MSLTGKQVVIRGLVLNPIAGHDGYEVLLEGGGVFNFSTARLRTHTAAASLLGDVSWKASGVETELPDFVVGQRVTVMAPPEGNAGCHYGPDS